MRNIIFALLLAAFVTPSFAQADAKAAKKESRSLKTRVAAFLERIKAQSVIEGSVAAVRGANPDKKTMDTITALTEAASRVRERLLTSYGKNADEVMLRKTYRALSVSYLVRAEDLSGDSKIVAPSAGKLRGWKAMYTADGVPEDSAAYLSSGGRKHLDKLAKTGWNEYALALAASAKGAPDSPSVKVNADTAELDETEASLLRLQTSGGMDAEKLAQSYYLAALGYEALAMADYTAGETDSAAAAPQPAQTQTLASANISAVALSADSTVADFNPKSIYQKASPSVLVIICSGEDGYGELGSGSLIDSSGLVLTNAHVVIKESTGKPFPTIITYFKPAKMTGDRKKDLVSPIRATVIKYDAGLDLALIRLERVPAGETPLSLGDPDSVSVGDRVAAIGHPEQGGFWTLTTGVISTVVADIGGVSGKDVFQTDTSINRGNSGGPLLNSNGNIVGVNTLMARRAADGLTITSVNFAVKSNVAAKWINSGATKMVAVKHDAQQSVSEASSAQPAQTPAKATPVKHETITESTPFTSSDVIEEQMKEMEDMEGEMHQEVLKHMPSGH